MSDYVYNLVKKHHSVRKFKNKPLSEDVVKKLVEAGQSASTSSFLQAYSIIGIDDEKIKENLREVSGQPYVVENGYLFVFVIDYYRHHLVDQHAETDMGYGIVFLGSLRNDVERVREILDLPDYVFPVFGMAVGEPADDENGAAKPRLPFDHVFHHNKYHADKETQYAQMADYDQTISEYYDQRTNGNRKETWSQQIEMFLGNKARLDMLEQLQKSGLIQR
ncbi:nitroreductase family protein [Staphylococcus aureus]|uniref:nitroreductase family protein n=1 Tax=Staphylococcus aureus TaxID=1280 RepID=UPI0007CA73D1|nr:nitroreductase family protein [Staphylococcus aureus]MBF1921754.1 nitroreductase family protein [Staphylococcus aureus]MBW0728983.1 nitroreductase family protein [Staphylococcus aureus]MBW0737554.1 nitroreductase family protein [Staphylococcus aureus]MBW0743180.1 nitroreductase family protein [Staphylococcus aureus]MBW0746006.1 nitroreductase family protein [Staphylococcus aureus]